ncbi:hypothetical protein D0T53_12915 [Dysgonomonas sp. 216]|nr:hypothetical protein [Dysgonomonas sp. 216]
MSNISSLFLPIVPFFSWEVELSLNMQDIKNNDKTKVVIIFFIAECFFMVFVYIHLIDKKVNGLRYDICCITY